MKVVQRGTPSSLHTAIEFTFDLDQTYNDSEDIHLIFHEDNDKFRRSSLKSPLGFWISQIIRVVIGSLILLGQYVLFYFDKLMCEIFPRKRTLMLIIQIFCCAFRHFENFISKATNLSIDSIYHFIFFSLGLIFMSIIYNCLFGKKVIIDEQNHQLDPDEGSRELTELRDLMRDFSSKFHDLQKRHEQIPFGLSLAILLNASKLLDLENNLIVASDLRGTDNANILTSADIESIPKEKYSIHELNGPDMCSLCLRKFQHNQDLRKLPCGHGFHVKCIDDSLKIKGVCADCKVPVQINRNPEENENVQQQQGYIMNPVTEVKVTVVSRLKGLLELFLYYKNRLRNKKLA